MRRLATILAGIAAVGTVAVFGSGAGGDEGGYEVRAIFANGGFLVPGEEVRIAGAKVGQIVEVDVTRTDEAAHEDGSPEPGSAIVVMRIEDPAFHDFREDAGCLIRPQGLLGERFVECKPTQPRAAGSEGPPSLEPIPEGERGEGQYLLPLEQNGKAVDLDLINNIMDEPYPDRFRLILNEFGAAFAARGDDLEQLIERANPALQRTDEVLKILAKQNQQLAQLARDSDTTLAPLAREREHVSGFINNANVAAQATAERREDLEAQFQKLPGFLVELRATMGELDEFSERATPVVSDLGDAAPSLERMTLALGPFSRGSRTALNSLGNAAGQAGPALVNADPILVRIREVAQESGPLGRELNGLLSSLRRNEGYENLMGFLFNAAGATNAFDSFGRFARLLLPLNNCVDYEPFGDSGCGSFFAATGKQGSSGGFSKSEFERLIEGGARNARNDRPSLPDLGFGTLDGGSNELEVPEEEEEPPAEEPPAEEDGEIEDAESAAASKRTSRMLMDYLVGGEAKRGRGR